MKTARGFTLLTAVLGNERIPIHFFNLPPRINTVMVKAFFSYLRQASSLLLGMLMLLSYWVWGYDGITFSDEVTYLQLGDLLWSGNSVVTDYHFSSRWAAFLFSGFFTQLFGFSDRYASLATLAFYWATLYVVWRISPLSVRRWAVLFFIGNVYLFHFLTKVYPDGFLILWVTLVPAAAIYRSQRPLAAACIMAAAFFIGFCTKETMILLAPLPALLFFMDLRERKRLHFYYYFGGISLVLAFLYLGYYKWQFGDWLFRFKSVNEGHYISEYTYHDKGIFSVLRRITYLPMLTFIDRTYWLWWVMATPGIYYGIKKNQPIAFEFGASVLCLLVGFWFMSSTLEFYNPIYLNPRHLIILIPPLSVCIALGFRHWHNAIEWKMALALLLAFASGYCLLSGDWKVGLFYLLFAGLLFLKQERILFAAMAAGLLFPVLFSVKYQHQLKNYPHFLEVLRKETSEASNTSPLLTHEFIYFSREVLLEEPEVQSPIISMAELDRLAQNPPDSLTLFIYGYYRHAYPAEQVYIDKVEQWLEKDYDLIYSEQSPWLSIRKYRRAMKAN